MKCRLGKTTAMRRVVLCFIVALLSLVVFGVNAQRPGTPSNRKVVPKRPAAQPTPTPTPVRSPSPVLPTPPTTPAGEKLQFASRDIDYGSAISPAGAYANALSEPDKFPPEQRLVIKGVVVGKDGKPLPGLVVHLFPLAEKGPELVLGFAAGAVSAGNPKATTDGTGTFTITTGPLWEHSKAVMIGLLVPRSPDRPFDLGVRAVENAAGPLRVSLTGKQRVFDLGAIVLAASQPVP